MFSETKCKTKKLMSQIILMKISLKNILKKNQYYFLINKGKNYKVENKAKYNDINIYIYI